jgi:hypothetical protein
MVVWSKGIVVAVSGEAAIADFHPCSLGLGARSFLAPDAAPPLDLPGRITPQGPKCPGGRRIKHDHVSCPDAARVRTNLTGPSEFNCARESAARH